jgi:hypothetical protein
MKTWGFLLVSAGAFFAIAGFASYSSDIQLGIAVGGMCLAGIGGVLIALSGIKKDIMNVWLWIKEMEKK